MGYNQFHNSGGTGYAVVLVLILQLLLSVGILGGLGYVVGLGISAGMN